MLRATLALLALALAAGCPAATPGGSADAPTGPDSGDGGDGPSGSGGLVFQLVARPTLPNITSTVSVDEVKVSLRDVRAIGDTATGDPNTSLAQRALDYRSDRDPEPIAFPLAPPGLYSELDARLGQAEDGGGNAYEIRGSVAIGGQTFTLEIDDAGATGAITIPLGGVRVDTSTVVTIALDLRFLGAIDWSAVPKDGDKITLGSSSPAIAQVRAGMLAAFAPAP